jgi:hypothetical protein
VIREITVRAVWPEPLKGKQEVRTQASTEPSTSRCVLSLTTASSDFQLWAAYPLCTPPRVGDWNSVAPECGCLELPNLETAAEWLRDDPEFIASLNRAKSFRRERLRADVRSLASAAMATLRELVRPDVAASIRLRASLAILQAADALNIEAIGPTPAEGVEAKLEDERFIDSLSG